MKKIAVVMFLLLLGGITAVPCEAKVHRGKTKDGVTYQYNTKTKTLTMSGKRIKGSYPENYSIKTHGYVKDKPWQKWSWKARKIVLKKGIESVTDSAFSGFYKVKKIVFPKTLKQIGSQAFYGIGIKRLVLPDSVTEISRGAFDIGLKYSDGIKEIKLSRSLKKIGDDAFTGQCFTSITIPQNVEFIGARAFDECSELKTVYIKSKKIKKVGKDIFRNIFDGVTVYVPKSKVKKYRKMFSRSMYANVKAMK